MIGRGVSLSKELWVSLTISSAALFTLCSYEFLRPPSNVLFKASYGAEGLPIIMAIMPAAVFLILYGYGWLLSKIGPRRTLFWTTLLSSGMLLASYIAIRNGSSLASAILYLFREAYIVLLIEQYWSFINSTLEQSEAKKLNGPIAGLSSLGAITGGILVSQLAGPLGTQTLLIFSAGLLIPAAFISDLGYAHCGEPEPTRQERGGKKGHLALNMFKTSPLLTLLLIVVMTTQVVSAVLGLSFQTILQDVIPNMDQQTAYQGKFFATVNTAAATLQFIAAPLLMSLIPAGFIHLGLPLIHIGAIAFFILHPSLQSCALAYMLFKSIDYSLFRATKETLYIPLSFDARYRAKEVIDVFGYRFSKGGSSLLIAVVQKMGIAMSGLYGWIALSAAALWALLIIPVIRQLHRTPHRDMLETRPTLSPSSE